MGIGPERQDKNGTYENRNRSQVFSRKEKNNKLLVEKE
jgi:hypothetical protein